MAIVKFRQVEERIWQRIDTIFFFSSERDRQVCYTIDTRRSNYANIFSYHFPSFYYIRTWQENPQKEILATPKYESKEEEQSGWFFCFLFLTTLQFLTGILCRTTIAK